MHKLLTWSWGEMPRGLKDISRTTLTTQRKRDWNWKSLRNDSPTLDQCSVCTLQCVCISSS